MEYKILKGEALTIKSSIKKLELQVEEEIKTGWLPQGGIAFDAADNIYQAMIKPEQG